MKCKEIIKKLEQLYPLSFAASWDNSGFQIGDLEKEIHTVYLALDATDEVIDHAIEAGADLLITHHPMIFSGIKSVTADHFIGRRIIKLIKEDLCYYAAHTNYDVAQMADTAASCLGLQSCEVLSPSCINTETGTKEGYGRIGEFSHEMTLKECAQLIKKIFSLNEVKVFGDERKWIKKAAILPGSGKSMMADALKAQADVMITGDIDHHAGIDAVAQGIAVIDAGHYGTEHIFMDQVKQELEKAFPTLEIKREEFCLPFWMS